MRDAWDFVVELPPTLDVGLTALSTNELLELLRQLPQANVALDASAVQHIDAFGLVALYDAHAVANFFDSSLRIIRPSAAMARALRISRLHEAVPVDW